MPCGAPDGGLTFSLVQTDGLASAPRIADGDVPRPAIVWLTYSDRGETPISAPALINNEG